MRKGNARNGVRRLENNAPPASRRIVQDPEFVRDVHAIVGRVAGLSQQHRPIVVDQVMDGVAVILRGGVHAMLAMSGNLVIGAIDGKPIHDTRAKHGPAWSAVNNLLERHDIGAAISDQEPAGVMT